MASIVVLGPFRHSASLAEDGHRLHECADAAALAAQPCDLVIAADGSLDDGALASLRAGRDACPEVLLLAPPAARPVREGVFETIAADADVTSVRAAVDRALRYRVACRQRDDARADRDAVLGALALLVDEAAHLVHDVKAPGTAVRQALRAVAGHLGADQDSLLSEFGGELERVESLLRAVLRLAQPLPPAAAPAPLAEVFAAVRAAWAESEAGRESPLELRLEAASLTLPGRAEDWITALGAALEHVAAGRPADRIELVGQAREGVVCLEIRLSCAANAVPAQLPPPSRDAGVGMAFCRRMVRESRGRLEMTAAALGTAVVCRIEVPREQTMSGDWRTRWLES